MTAWHLQPADQGPDQTPTSLTDSRDHHIVDIAALGAQHHVNDVATPASTSISRQKLRSRLRQLIFLSVLLLAMVVDVSVLYMLTNGDESVTAALQRDLLDTSTVTSTVTKTTTPETITETSTVTTTTTPLEGVVDVPKKPTQAEVEKIAMQNVGIQAYDEWTVKAEWMWTKLDALVDPGFSRNDFEWYAGITYVDGTAVFAEGKQDPNKPLYLHSHAKAALVETRETITATGKAVQVMWTRESAMPENDALAQWFKSKVSLTMDELKFGKPDSNKLTVKAGLKEASLGQRNGYPEDPDVPNGEHWFPNFGDFDVFYASATYMFDQDETMALEMPFLNSVRQELLELNGKADTIWESCPWKDHARCHQLGDTDWKNKACANYVGRGSLAIKNLPQHFKFNARASNTYGDKELMNKERKEGALDDWKRVFGERDRNKPEAPVELPETLDPNLDINVHNIYTMAARNIGNFVNGLKSKMCKLSATSTDKSGYAVCDEATCVEGVYPKAGEELPGTGNNEAFRKAWEAFRKAWFKSKTDAKDGDWHLCAPVGTRGNKMAYVGQTLYYNDDAEYGDEIESMFKTALQAFMLVRQQTTSGALVLHIGNWGAGVFGNNKALSVLLQLIAAKAVNADRVVYHEFEGDLDVDKVLTHFLPQLFAQGQDIDIQTMTQRLNKIKMPFGLFECKFCRDDLPKIHTEKEKKEHNEKNKNVPFCMCQEPTQ